MEVPRTAVVTGATHGLGEAIAEQLNGQGWNVVLVARNSEQLAAAAEKLLAGNGRRALPVVCDVSNAEEVRKAARQIVGQYGSVDVLVNNAGIPAPRQIEETDFGAWDEVIGTNLSGVFYMTRALWEALKESGAGYVINISGTNGLRGSSSPAYSSAKFGITGLTRSIAASGVMHNIRATVLYPGAMDTGWRGAPIGVKSARETMDPREVARYIGYLVETPAEFVVNESVFNPLDETWL